MSRSGGGGPARAWRRAVDQVETWFGVKRRNFHERREMIERKRSATWQVSIAVLAATLGAVGLGYLVVQLFFLPETVAESRLNRVPDLIGATVNDVVGGDGVGGYVVTESGRIHHAGVDSGEVIHQTPLPGTYHPRGDTLFLLVSLGAPDPTMPDLAGLEPDLARRVLERLGARLTPPRREASDLQPQGVVVETIPPGGSPLPAGTEVTLVLSRGGSFLTMPDVRGLTLPAARDSLSVYSLTVGEVVGIEGEPVDAGTAAADAQIVVTAQDPAYGRRIRSGSAVRLTLGERSR